MCGIHGALIVIKCPLVSMLAKQNICKVSHGLWLDSITPGIKWLLNSIFMLAIEVQTICASKCIKMT